MKKHLKPLLAAAALCVLALAGCGSKEDASASAAQKLMANVPEMERKTYNSFVFDMDVDINTATGDSGSYSLGGTLETWASTSHIYGTEITMADGSVLSPENYTDFSTGVSYRNMGSGWESMDAENASAMDYLLTAINSRDGGLELTDEDGVCTVSWSFTADTDYIFNTLTGRSETDAADGSGKVTAVFDPDTRQFKYFTIVVSQSGGDYSVALLDAVFYWDDMNNDGLIIEIPESVSNEAYLNATGIESTGEYNSVVNPMAEGFMKTYGGTASVTNTDDSSFMYWTLSGSDGLSSSVSYIRESNAASRYSENYSFMCSIYGMPVEEVDNGAYFYDSEIGEFTYIARGDGWYAEITVTGNAETTQGTLRIPLISYKSKLGI